MKDLGALWHALAGAAVTAVATLFVGAIAALLIFGFAVLGWVREVWQHDLRLTRHQWAEAVSWPAGAALGYGAALPVLWAVTR
jgi:hypothetical protein